VGSNVCSERIFDEHKKKAHKREAKDQIERNEAEKMKMEKRERDALFLLLRFSLQPNQKYITRLSFFHLSVKS